MESPVPAKRRSVRAYAIVAAVVAVAAGAGGWALTGGASGSASIADLGPAATVTRGLLIVSVTESGEISAEKRKVISNEIRFPVIIKSLVEEGQTVRKGDTVITFDCRELLDAIETKKLEVTTGKSAYLQAVENVELDKKEVANAVRKAEQAVVDAEADIRRYMEAGGPVKIADANAAITTARRDLTLAEGKLNFKLEVNADKELNSPFSENEIEAEKLSVDKLKIALQKAVSNYEMLIKYDDPVELRKLKTAVEDATLALARAKHTAKSKVLTAETDAETKKITFEMKSTQLTDLLAEAEKISFTADEEGLVVYNTGSNRWNPNNITVEVGAKINPRQQLMIIPDLTTLLVKTKVYEAIIDQVNVGLKAHVRLDSKPDTLLGGKVVKVGVLPDSQHGWLNPGVKIFKVDVKLDEDVPSLKPGMTAQVEIELRRLDNVLSVPVAAVFTEQEKTFCYRLADGQVERVEVKIGQMNDTRVEILTGLTEGDQVLLSQPTTLDEGGDKPPDEDAAPNAKPKAPKEPKAPEAGPPDRPRPTDKPARPAPAGRGQGKAAVG